MILERHGVRLKRLTEDKIEMVRQWRNDPRISQYMEYRDYISPAMQKIWFEKINNKHNYYFIIEFNHQEIGLINIKNIDYQKKTGEGGIFISNSSYLFTGVAYRAVLCLFDFIFENLKFKFLTAHILRSNSNAIKYNKLLGFTLCEREKDNDNQLYLLSKQSYIANREKIIRTF